MKIVVTGSLGHISKPLTEELVQKGHAVTVISSDPEKQKAIETMGATAAIGSLEDVDFLTATVTGADVVYTMIPPANYFDPNLDLLGYVNRLGANYQRAIQQAGVKRVVNLSSIGAHLPLDSGVTFSTYETGVNGLPTDVAIRHIRPTSFYYNLYGYVAMIKGQGFIGTNYGADDVVPWVSPVDIAAAVAEAIETPFTGRSFRYVASDERTCSDTARVLGEAIGKPDLEWKIITNEEMQAGMEAAGMKSDIVASLVAMYSTLHTGVLAEDYYRHRPVLGNVKLEDFAKEFAAAFSQS